MQNNSKITNSTIAALIVGLIVGFAGGAYWYKGKVNRDQTGKTPIVDEKMEDKTVDTMEDKSDTTDTMVKETPVSTVVDTNIIAASGQTAGNSVTVSKVISNTEIWVAVREDNEGLMGNVLGAKKVPAGTSENIKIELLRATNPDSKYYVVLYRDNGDGAFDPKVDALVESDGRVIVSTFRTNK